MTDRPLEERLEALERRLRALEERLGAPPGPAPPADPAPPPPVARAAPSAAPPATAPPPSAVRPRAPAPARKPLPSLSAALVLGWAGAGALVLAAAYLVRLSIVYGWLTPGRQVMVAAVAGAGLLAGGAVLRVRDRAYAGLLSAAGIAVLYLTIYASHLHHRLIGAPTATALVVAVAALSLGLHALYRSLPFVAFALAGSYSAPLLIPGEGSLLDLALYLTIWNLVYAAAAVRLGHRALYLVAFYASLLVFAVARAEGAAMGAWETAALFYLLQFVLFGAAVTLYSIRWKSAIAGPPMAFLHGLALFLLYTLEWGILDAHAADLAPWVAVGFATALYGAWLAARRTTGAAHGTSLLLVHGFGALVLVHAVWWEGVEPAWRPLAALAMALGLRALPRAAPRLRAGWIPWSVAMVTLLAFGWIHLVERWEASGLGDRPEGPVAAEGLLALWPTALYALYLTWPPRADSWAQRFFALAAAHFTALVGIWLLIHHWLGGPDTTIERLWLSLAWGALAVGWLSAAIPRGDQMLARSTLGIFALFAGKVLLFDLQGEESLVRVGVLAVLGAALYAGGWIYRRVLPEG